ISFCGACGKIVSLYSRFPFSSIQTTLQPVLNPGSIPITLFSPNGADNNNCDKFSEKTPIDCKSAFSLYSCNTSLDNAGSNKRLYESATALEISTAVSCFLLLNTVSSINVIASVLSILIYNFTKPSLLARNIANNRWAGALNNGSFQSKYCSNFLAASSSFFVFTTLAEISALR